MTSLRAYPAIWWIDRLHACARGRTLGNGVEVKRDDIIVLEVMSEEGGGGTPGGRSRRFFGRIRSSSVPSLMRLCDESCGGARNLHRSAGLTAARAREPGL